MKKKEENPKEEIKKNIKISSYFLNKEKTPSGYKCLCPFHKEDTPSFYITVKNEIELFKCFGCDKGGDIFTFLSLLENKDFTEVYNDLAHSLGFKQTYRANLQPYIDTITKINNIYKNNINSKPEVISFLTNRNLSKEDIQFFGLGYAEGSIISSLTSDEIKIAEEIGIINKGDNFYYDVIKNRITIPIFSKQNLLVGIGTRKFLDSDTYGKYINPANSKVYKKNSTIYGLNFALEEIKEKKSVIIVEGYFDFIKLYKNGIKNVVCILGTKLFSEQVKILSSLTDNFYFCLDGDKAGQNALVNNIKEAIKSGVNIYITELPDDHDPDSYIEAHGIQEFEKRINNSLDFVTYLSKKKELMIPMLEDLQTIIPKIESEVKQQFIYNSILNTTNIDLRISKDIKKSYFNKFQNEIITQNDTKLLKLFYNTDESNRNLFRDIFHFETEKALLLFLKIKNKKYNVKYTEEETVFLNGIDLKKKYTEEEILKNQQTIEEQNRLLKL